MIWVVYIYAMTAIVTAGGAIFRSAFWPGIAGLVGPLLCWWAGAGVAGSLLVGTSNQKRAGVVAGMVFFAAGASLLYTSGYFVRFWGLQVSGLEWGVIGTLIGLTCTSRQAAQAGVADERQTES
jgi:hypothetical protein